MSDAKDGGKADAPWSGMNGKESTGMTVAELETLLETFGGDPARWPAGRRQAAEALIAADAGARRALAEAQALDRLLSRASGPAPERLESLLDRIVDAAETDAMRPASAQASDNSAPAVTPTPSAEVIRFPAGKPRSEFRSRPRVSERWQAAAALAAALMLGVAAGTTNLADTAALSVYSVVGEQSADADLLLASLHLDPLAGVIDEDQR